MRVLVVTEIRLYRQGVADALRRLPEVDEALTAATGSEAVLTARTAECDVVVLDMALPDSTATARSILTARPHARVVALGVPEESPEVVACAEAGVCGYVSRDASLDDLIEALRTAMRGEAPCSGRVAAGLLNHIAVQARFRSGGSTQVPLTPREVEVFRLLGSGLSNKEIARTLDLQLSTVKNHVHNILSKYGASCRTQLAQAGTGS